MFPHTDQFHASITLSCSFLRKCIFLGFINHSFSKCKVFAIHGLKIWLGFYDTYHPKTGAIFGSRYLESLDSSLLQKERLLLPPHPPMAPPPPSMKKCLYPPFAMHKLGVAEPPLFRQVPEKQSGLWIIRCGLQCTNSQPHTAVNLATDSSSNRRCWQLRFFQTERIYLILFSF